MEILEWLQKWYGEKCNGDWEHSYGIEITTIDNPGWVIKINLDGTKLEGLKIEYTLVEISEDDWYSLKIENNLFEGAGDPRKLEFLLKKFKEIIDSPYE